MTESCARCTKHTSPGSLVALWDGNHYCVACIETACPGLSEYAIGHPCLDDTLLPNEIPRPRHGWSIAITAIALVSLAVLSIGLLPLPVMGMICSGLFVAGGVWLVFALLWLMQRTIRGRLPRCVVVQDGIIQIQETDITHEFALTECRWFVADTRSDQITWFMPRLPAIILCFPTHPWRIACGLEPEAMARWRGFLQLIGLTIEKRIGWGSGTISAIKGVALGTIIGITAGWISTPWVPDTTWIIALGILGAIDGLLLGLSWAFRHSLREAIDFNRGVRIFLTSAILPLMILGPRRGLGIRGDWMIVLAVMLLNGLLLPAVLFWIDCRSVERKPVSEDSE